jgi:hypothetical protein
MFYDIIIIISITAIIQSIFGTGVLLFGTPLLLIFGYSFHFALIILLPTSILISLLQLKDNFVNVDINFYKKLIIYCIPFIIVSLYYSVTILTQTNLFIGIFLVTFSLKNRIQLINTILRFLNRYEKVYFILMGILHGITNLGGSLLSASIFNKDFSKLAKRSTIAVCYLSMAIIQIITLFFIVNSKEILNVIYIPYWLLGVLVFILVEKYIFFKIDDQKYINYSNVFLFIIGILVIIKALNLFSPI